MFMRVGAAATHDGHHGHQHPHGGPGSHPHPGAHGAHQPHAHGHGHGPHGHGSASTRALAFTLALTIGYGVVELVVSFWAGSLSLLADAGHMLTDAGALVLSLVAARISLRPRSAKNTYGYRRAEVIGALINASTMLITSLYIVIEAARRLSSPREIHGTGLLYTAVGGLVVNLLAAAILARAGRESLNVRAALLHVVGDALGSVAAIVAGAAVVALHVNAADPIASIAISIVMLISSVRLLRDVSAVLMEATPAGVDPALLTRTILETPGVQAVHDLHVWCLTPTQPMLTAHVVLKPAAHGTDVAKRVGERLHSLHGVDHVTIQPEAPEPELVSIRSRKKP